MPHDSISLSLSSWIQGISSHLCSKAQKHGLILFPFNDHACQNSSQEIPASIGIAAVGGLRLVHPSLWGNRCYHWFTLQACESKSTSVTTYGKELSAAAEQKSTERKVNQDIRQDTASTLKTDKWNLFDSSCGKPTWAEERKREERDNSSFSALHTIHSACSLMPYTLPPTLKTAGRCLHVTAGLLRNLLPIPSLSQRITQRVWLKSCFLPFAVTKRPRMFWKCWFKSADRIPSLPFILPLWCNVGTLSKLREVASNWASAVQMTAILLPWI